ncbi:MAG: hypothetical protein JWR61_1671 [Ferruginibacter sp.]|uniref:hypothetical protein n=1 Tax=Ferruginibacter sp. TaxID=1940288 RepID=UPI002659F8A6|nr:hypothetical protein [Ferruginibacter sp.]MDB5276716.1 hypothetical protein [Ferruginibacter sp.]
MRSKLLLTALIFTSFVKAQTVLPGSYGNHLQQQQFTRMNQMNDSLPQPKWFISRYAGISSSFTFFKGGNATVFSVPAGIQLNRRLNNNWYAFANLAAAPASVNFNHSFMFSNTGKFGQNNNLFARNHFDMPASASLGLMYMNDQKTFSISGSIGVERSSYPFMPFNQASPNVAATPFKY